MFGCSSTRLELTRQKAYAYFLFQNSEYNSLPQAVEITLSVDFDLANRPVTEWVNSIYLYVTGVFMFLIIYAYH